MPDAFEGKEDKIYEILEIDKILIFLPCEILRVLKKE